MSVFFWFNYALWQCFVHRQICFPCDITWSVLLCAGLLQSNRRQECFTMWFSSQIKWGGDSAVGKIFLNCFYLLQIKLIFNLMASVDALVETTKRNPPRAVQGLEESEMHLSCSGIPREGEVHNLTHFLPQSVKDFILQSLNGPCSKTRISKQQVSSTSKVDSPSRYSTPSRVLLNLHESAICP